MSPAPKHWLCPTLLLPVCRGSFFFPFLVRVAPQMEFLSSMEALFRRGRNRPTRPRVFKSHDLDPRQKKTTCHRARKLQSKSVSSNFYCLFSHSRRTRSPSVCGSCVIVGNSA